jgi:hypothetical protein
MSATTELGARNITLENVVGNYIILDLGQGRVAGYAHLQPGSLKVKTWRQGEGTPGPCAPR